MFCLVFGHSDSGEYVTAAHEMWPLDNTRVTIAHNGPDPPRSLTMGNIGSDRRVGLALACQPGWDWPIVYQPLPCRSAGCQWQALLDGFPQHTTACCYAGKRESNRCHDLMCLVCHVCAWCYVRPSSGILLLPMVLLTRVSWFLGFLCFSWTTTLPATMFHMRLSMWGNIGSDRRVGLALACQPGWDWPIVYQPLPCRSAGCQWQALLDGFPD